MCLKTAYHIITFAVKTKLKLYETKQRSISLSQKLEKWAKNNTNEAKNFIKEFDEVFKDNLRSFTIQDWVKDVLQINVDMALTELIERIDNAKCEVN